MQTVSRTTFTTVKTEGAILPADLLQRVAEGKGLDGLRPEDYHLLPNERLNEAINRSWNRCQSAWSSFDQQRQRLPATDTGTTLTRERWLLVLFQELGYGRLQFVGGLSLDGITYPISHLWGHTPIHLVTFCQDLDRRGEVRGAVNRSPHSLLQEFLNRSDDHLWCFVSNGLRLRLLRDNVSLTRAAYVEFDLEAMMAGELYADFSLLWLVCHQSRVEGEPPGECWLERWSKMAAEQGVRALDVLRDGVQEAIVALGRGFLAHRANGTLKASLQSGELSAQDYYRQLLRLVYRLIFLFVAEDRGLLLQPSTPDEIQRRYTDFYSVRRLRDMAETLRGGPYADLYRSLRLVFALLRDGYPALGLPALGSFLFSDHATPDLDEADLDNNALLEAVRALAFTIERKVRRPVDYRNLGAEELGSVYESLLELHPQLNADAAAFELDVAAGSERKTTGSYYTPASLIHCLLDSALEPVVEDRLAQAERDPTAQEAALLDIKVVDPACGSGHFLIAAAHRLARHLARVRTGDDEPAPAELRAALRDVVRHCIHGVDINPMAVELCKVALWMETLDPGKPLSFLDRNIQCGNSLIGATPALLDKGIPDGAFEPIEGDDKAYCREFKKKNRQERSGQLSLFKPDLQPWERLGNLAASMMNLAAIGDDTLDNVRRKQKMYESLVRSSDYRYGRLWADAWCAAFVWKKTKEFAYPITEEVFRTIERNPFNLPKWMEKEIGRLREQYQFFHWHLAFPHVFTVPASGEEAKNKQTGWNGGFDVVLGNPPWEKLTILETEYFSGKDAVIASTKTKAARKKALEDLRTRNPLLYSQWLQARRKSDGSKSLVQSSGRFPMSSKGELNTYLPFTELGLHLINRGGHCGMVVKSSIFTADTAAALMSHLIQSKRLISLYDFRNWKNLFPGVGYHERFSLISFVGSPISSHSPTFAFYCDLVGDLSIKGRVYSISSDQISLLSPNSGKVPILPTKRDRDLLLQVASSFPVLVNNGTNQNPWSMSYGSLFHMSGASEHFKTKEQLWAEGYELRSHSHFMLHDGENFVPFYEGKYIQIYDHRFSSFEGVPAKKRFGRKPGTHTPTPQQKGNPGYNIEPRYWIPHEVAQVRFRKKLGDVQYYCAARLVTNVISNARTVMACIVPGYPANNMIVSLGLTVEDDSYGVRCGLLVSLFNSFAFDYIARLRVSENLLKGVLFELPAPPPQTFEEFLWPDPENQAFRERALPRILELTYTTWDLQPFAQDCGYDGPPFRWDEERRFLLRCELDAAYFHLYGIARDDVDYIMDTFPIVKRKDEAAHGEYRTKRVILEIYDAMQQAIESGEPYQTLLDPPPADPRVAHPPRETEDDRS